MSIVTAPGCMSVGVGRPMLFDYDDDDDDDDPPIIIGQGISHTFLIACV
jgi:hypothetical protein